VPFENNCRDGRDDDGDALIDCCDTDCVGTEDCLPACPAYGVPPLPEDDCDDCLDNDCDGPVDGDDPDCMGVLYASPF
jgi:hypothetical protein